MTQLGPRVIAVVGPAGAPGRSVLAANLAVLAARRKLRVLLIDLDLFAPSQRFIFSASIAPAGVEAAIRLLHQERLDIQRLQRLAAAVMGTRERLRVLAGLQNGELLPELTPERLRSLVEFTASSFDVVVIDNSPLGAAPTSEHVLATVAVATHTVLVGDPSPSGVHRLIEVSKVLRQARPRHLQVVINRHRSALHPISEVAEAVRELGGFGIDFVIPEDSFAFDMGTREGRPAVLAWRKTTVRPQLTALLDVILAPDDG